MGLQLRFPPKFAFYFALTLGPHVCACQGKEGRVCVPNETQDCRGPGACKGAQSCVADGSGFSPCDCDGFEPVSEAVPDAAPPSVREPPPSVSPVGAICQQDEECGPQLTCWSEASRGRFGVIGGPARGYCTQTCTTDAQCEEVDPASACLSSEAGNRICARRCLSKDPDSGEGKCLNRPDVACYSSVIYGLETFDPLRRQEGFCVPLCGSDAECPGAFCDPVLGLCVDTPPVGAPTGTPCTTGAECMGGVCVATPVGGICTAGCVFGGAGCGYPSDVGKRLETYCVLPWIGTSAGGEGIGDLGICGELCDTAFDCAHPEAVCELDAAFSTSRAGACNYPAAQSVGSDAGLP